MTELIRSFVDANVLIHAFRGTSDIQRRARALLNDPRRVFVASDLLRLEVMPKARYFGRDAETKFYQAYFAMVDEMVVTTSAQISMADELSSQYGLAAMDALLMAAAMESKADEFVTSERATKPLFRVDQISVVSLAA